MTTKKIFRCAVYTRKSHEEGLEQEFNSLHAQREACEAYIKSQKHEGWQIVKTAYDDGGFTGGNMERPALKKLLADISAGEIDVIVVYKVDRLSRSLHDFARMVEVFDKNDVSFVSVTQQFNTTNSMGRLTLNVLLSFAQFEREVTGERIRDKIAASKKKGMWMGGVVPLGYDVVDKKLIVNAKEAETVRYIFSRYLELRCVRLLQEDIKKRGIRPKIRKNNIKSNSGNILSRGALYKILSNPVYIGRTRHKADSHPGQHQPIIEQVLWDQVHQCLTDNTVKGEGQNRKTDASLLMGKLFDESGHGLTPSHANKKGRRYRYYVSRHLTIGPGSKDKTGWRLPAQEIESTVIRAIRHILEDKPAVAYALRHAGIRAKRISACLDISTEISRKLEVGEDIAHILPALLNRVELKQDGVRIILSLVPLVADSALCPVITKDIPMQMQRRGIEMRLVIEGSDLSKSDPGLIRIIAYARTWFEDLESGRMKSVAEIAARDQISMQYICKLLPLAFLAPQIVRAIEQGNHPINLTPEALIKRTNLPWDWNMQKPALGKN